MAGTPGNLSEISASIGMNDDVVIAPNAKRRHAGPRTLDWNGDDLPALPDAPGWTVYVSCSVLLKNSALSCQFQNQPFPPTSAPLHQATDEKVKAE